MRGGSTTIRLQPLPVRLNSDRTLRRSELVQSPSLAVVPPSAQHDPPGSSLCPLSKRGQSKTRCGGFPYAVFSSGRVSRRSSAGRCDDTARGERPIPRMKRVTSVTDVSSTLHGRPKPDDTLEEMISLRRDCTRMICDDYNGDSHIKKSFLPTIKKRGSVSPGKPRRHAPESETRSAAARTQRALGSTESGSGTFGEAVERYYCNNKLGSQVANLDLLRKISSPACTHPDSKKILRTAPHVKGKFKAATGCNSPEQQRIVQTFFPGPATEDKTRSADSEMRTTARFCQPAVRERAVFSCQSLSRVHQYNFLTRLRDGGQSKQNVAGREGHEDSGSAAVEVTFGQQQDEANNNIILFQ